VFIHLLFTGSKGNYAVMQGNKTKSGRVSNTSTIVAPLPMNTPLRRDSKTQPVPPPTTSTNSHLVWANLPSTDVSRGEDTSNVSSGVQKSAWAKSETQTINENIPVAATTASHLMASNRNWAEMNSDDDDDELIINNQQPEVIMISRDEVLESDVDKILNAESDRRARDNFRGSEHGGYGRADDYSVSDD